MGDELEEYTGNSGRGKVNGVDQKLIRWYGVLTPEQIAKETGLEADYVAKRTQELLGTRDYLGDAARVNALMTRMETAAAELESRLPEASDRNASAIGNSIGGLLGRSLGELRKLRDETRDDADAVRASYAKMLVAIVEAAFYKTKADLAELYPDLASEEIDTVFNSNLKQISAKYDADNR